MIINNVGSGKTTYLYHYFLVGVKEYKLDSKIDGILIDIREFGEGDDISSEKLEEFIHNKIHEHLTSKYPNISSPSIELGEQLFKDELIPFKSLINHKRQKNPTDYENYLFSKIDTFVSDIKLFNRARIRYLRRKNGKKIFIVIDNVDHFGKKTQERIFGLSTKLLNELKVGVIMSARDYTLPTAFRHVPLSAFQPRFLHLAFPDTKGVLQKRISWLFNSDFIEEIFKVIGKDQIEIYSPSGFRYVFDRYKLEKEFNIILDSLLNEEIIKILENISNYDMRAMLNLVRVALSSGYLFPEEREIKNKVKTRDFLRAIMCGNNPFYFPDDPSTMVLNLFDDNDPNYEGNNLIRIRTLQAIKLFGNKAPIDEILKFMKSLGYNIKKVKDIMQLLIDISLIESPYHEGNNIERDQIIPIPIRYSFYKF